MTMVMAIPAVTMRTLRFSNGRHGASQDKAGDKKHKSTFHDQDPPCRPGAISQLNQYESQSDR
jgi:hypothetical protein